MPNLIAVSSDGISVHLKIRRKIWAHRGPPLKVTQGHSNSHESIAWLPYDFPLTFLGLSATFANSYSYWPKKSCEFCDAELAQKPEWRGSRSRKVWRQLSPFQHNTEAWQTDRHTTTACTSLTHSVAR